MEEAKPTVSFAGHLVATDEARIYPPVERLGLVLDGFRKTLADLGYDFVEGYYGSAGQTMYPYHLRDGSPAFQMFIAKVK